MPEVINIPATEDTPAIRLDAGKGQIEISGKALPEDSLAFFKPIYDWLKEYYQSPLDTTELHLHLDYINSASTRHLFNIISGMQDLIDKQKNAKVIWHCKSSDEMMKNKGEELQSIVDIPFEIKEV